MSDHAQYALDTSFVIAALAGWHDRHDEARAWLAALSQLGSPIVIPATVWFETASVLTRMPPPYRLTPSAVRQILEALAVLGCSVASMPSDSVLTTLTDGLRAGVSGGALHDLHVAASAQAAGATHLVTLNPKDFQRPGFPALQIVAPGVDPATEQAGR